MDLNLDLLKSLVAALLLGGLIGLERESFIQLEKQKRFGGVRTFSLIAFLGALSVFISSYSMTLFYILVAGFLLVVGVAYYVSAMNTKNISALPSIVALIVFFIGYLSGQQQFWIATFIALVVFAIIHFRETWHTFAKKVKKEELYSAVKFIIVTLLILPILPDKGYGPFEVFNPFIIWLMVVFISGISFVSYIAIKLIGPKRGIGLTGFLAGLISSTAVTLSFSEQSKANKKVINPYIFGVVIASSAVFFRILVEVFVLNNELFFMMIIPFVVMGITGTIGAIYYWKKEDKAGKKKIAKTPLKLKSPFQLSPALKFGLLFGAILFLSKISLVYLGSQGIYLTSVVSGIADTDAITVSLSRLSAMKELDLNTAMLGITIATMTNVVFKGGVFYFLGNRVVAKSILKVFGLIIVAGVVSTAAVMMV